MSLFARTRPRQQRVATVDGPLPSRLSSGAGTVGYTPESISHDTALRHSAVWACCVLAADLISTLPCDTYRKHDGKRLEVAKPSVLLYPGGEDWDYLDWMWASTFDLRRAGNTIGLITERYSLTSPLYPRGVPSRIELQDIRAVTVIQKRGETRPRYRIDGKEYDADEVWHEKQYPVAGAPIGLDPIAYAAWTLAEGMTMAEFARQWFSRSGIPRARLRNTQKTLDTKEARIIKARHRASVQHGDLFVHGSDWEYDLMQAEAMGIEWLEGRKAGVADVARYLGAPVDLIEAAIPAGSTINYANVTQRHLQYLVLKLGPAVIRREARLSNLLPRPRYVKLNSDALLRMDPMEREKVITEKIKGRRMTVTEARRLDELPPLTDAEIQEFATLFGEPGKASDQKAQGSDGDGGEK